MSQPRRRESHPMTRSTDPAFADPAFCRDATSLGGQVTADIGHLPTKAPITTPPIGPTPVGGLTWSTPTSKPKA